MSDQEERVTSPTGGQKGSKIERFDLIPTEPLRLLAELYGKGAKKYSEGNWRLGYDWKLSYASAQRHMNLFWAGEDIDPEMGIPHVICAAFHMFTLAEFMRTHPEFDSRVRAEVEATLGTLMRPADVVHPHAEGDWLLTTEQAGDVEP